MSTAGLTIKVENLPEVRQRLTTIGLRLSDLDFTGIVEEGLRLAAQYAPKRSGALRESIRGRAFKTKGIIRAGSRKVPYAAAINYGWKRRGIEPALFMQKADEQLAKRAPDELRKQVRAILRSRGMIYG